MSFANQINDGTYPPQSAALPPVRSEQLLEWIVSRITTMDGKPMSIGRDTSEEIVARIRKHSNAPDHRRDNTCLSCGKAVDPAGYCNHCDAMGTGPYQQGEV